MKLKRSIVKSYRSLLLLVVNQHPHELFFISIVLLLSFASAPVRSAAVVSGYDSDLLYLDAGRARLVSSSAAAADHKKHHKLELITSKSNGKIISDYFGLNNFQPQPPQLAKKWPASTHPGARDGLATTNKGDTGLEKLFPVSPNNPVTSNSNPIFASKETPDQVLSRSCHDFNNNCGLFFFFLDRLPHQSLPSYHNLQHFAEYSQMPKSATLSYSSSRYIWNQ